MGEENQNHRVNGWTEYGKLVLKELERLNEGQEKLRKDMDDRFAEINNTLSQFKSTEKDVEELKSWKEKVTEVWSVTQMKESKGEIYKQKGQWQKVLGIVLAVQIIFAAAIALAKFF